MKAEELRLKNLLLYKGDLVEVLAINDDTVKIRRVGRTHRVQSIITDYDKVAPIILTEEWLLKFGFEKENENSWLSPQVKGSRTRINMIRDETFYIAINEFRIVRLSCVHKLQNFIYELQEGEELTHKHI